MCEDLQLVREAETCGNGATIHNIREAIATYRVYVAVANNKKTTNRLEAIEQAENAEANLRSIVRKSGRYRVACAGADLFYESL